MTEMRFVYAAVKGEYSKMLAAQYLPIAQTATATIKQTTETAKKEARQVIAAAGFSRKWQNATRGDVYPPKGVSVNAAGMIYNKILYSGVFEAGATISGKPFLWIPVTGLPKRVGGKRMTPRVFVELIGPLHSVNRPGRNPILAGFISASASSAKLTIAKLRSGQKRKNNKGAVKSVPCFVGIPQVQIRQRFGLNTVFDKADKNLAAVYNENAAKFSS